MIFDVGNIAERVRINAGAERGTNTADAELRWHFCAWNALLAENSEEWPKFPCIIQQFWFPYPDFVPIVKGKSAKRFLLPWEGTVNDTVGTDTKNCR